MMKVTFSEQKRDLLGTIDNQLGKKEKKIRSLVQSLPLK
jgi:hypothetical protein